MGTPADIFSQIQQSHQERLKDIVNRAQITFNEIDKGMEDFARYVNKLVTNGSIDNDVHKEIDNSLKCLDKRNARPTRGVKVKKEKISEGYESNAGSSTESVSSTASTIKVVEKIKTEKDDMPAPSFIPPKRKPKESKTEKPSRSTRTKGKKVTNLEGNSRDSDVVLQNATSTIITLSDSEESDNANAVKETNGRSTRTKTRNAKAAQESEKETDMDSTSSIKAEETSSSINTTDTRSTFTKTTKKGKMTEDEDNPVLPRTTRTKTIRKAQKDENILENDDGSKGKTAEEKEDNWVPPRTTRTKTIRKGQKEENHTEGKKENEEEIPAPTRSTRTKTIRKAQKEENDGLKENNKENLEREVPADDKIVPEVTRTTRTKTGKVIAEHNEVVNVETKNNGQLKRCRSESMDRDDVEKESKKKSISNSPKKEDCDSTVRTEYEDARSIMGQAQINVLDATYVAGENDVPALNTTVTVCSNNNKNDANNRTVTVDKHKFDIFNTKSSYRVSDILTDDDDSREIKTPPKIQPGKSAKEVFSPYEKTTLKKKVEAFEKLQLPKEMTSKIPNLKSATPSVKEKAKLFTPIGSRFLPSSSSTSKVTRVIAHSSINTDSFQAMKSAQKESREKRMQEKEQALMKKEAMLHAQAEAKKKLNEEKQLKAQQQRKALEAEKLKQIELHKQKEERLRQRELEKAEYLQKKKIEAEKLRLAQKKKIQELQAQREDMLAEQSRNPPVYMTTKPPVLPTTDCYDSDDPNYKKLKPPSWCSDGYARTMQLAMLAAGDKIKNTLFCRHAQTPDLKEIFQAIDPVKLKRSSSILWRKPPRYTMMPDLNETTFREDEEIFDYSD